MSNNPLRSELSNLERKLILLISNHQKLKEELIIVKKENQELKRQLGRREEQIYDFQNRDKISKIVNGMVVGNDSKATELSDMLNEYINEVDKCIAQLSE